MLQRRPSLPLAEYDYVFKIAVVGNVRVGKTSFIELFASNHTRENYIPTIGLDFCSKSVKLEGENYKLQLWDTSGQARFRSLIPGYIKDAKGVFVVYDITDKTTFRAASEWLSLVKDSCQNDPVVVLLGNKTDLAQHREVSPEEAQQWADARDLDYKEISARNAQTLDDLVVYISRALSAKFPQDSPLQATSMPTTRLVQSPSLGPVEFLNDPALRRLRERMKIRQKSESSA